MTSPTLRHRKYLPILAHLLINTRVSVMVTSVHRLDIALEMGTPVP